MEAHTEVQPFLWAYSDLVGLYANYDVDVILFRYSSGSESASQFWEALTSRVAADGWRQISDDSENTVRVFEREKNRKEPAINSREQTRVAFDSANQVVVVGYAQADTEDDEVSFAETSEGEWAESFFWPRFDEEIGSQ